MIRWAGRRGLHFSAAKPLDHFASQTMAIGHGDFEGKTHGFKLAEAPGCVWIAKRYNICYIVD